MTAGCVYYFLQTKMAEHCSISKQSRLYSGKQELVKVEKKKSENGIQTSLTFQKANRYYNFDVRRWEGYMKVSSLRYSILNTVGLDELGLFQPEQLYDSIKLDTENRMAPV